PLVPLTLRLSFISGFYSPFFSYRTLELFPCFTHTVNASFHLDPGFPVILVYPCQYTHTHTHTPVYTPPITVSLVYRQNTHTHTHSHSHQYIHPSPPSQCL